MVTGISDKERLVLETLIELGKPISEDKYHMMQSIMDDSGRGLGFRYELKYWNQVNGSYRSEFGGVPFSQELHDIIEGLVERGLVARTSDNPIEISYQGDQNGSRRI